MVRTDCLSTDPASIAPVPSKQMIPQSWRMIGSNGSDNSQHPTTSVASRLAAGASDEIQQMSSGIAVVRQALTQR